MPARHFTRCCQISSRLWRKQLPAESIARWSFRRPARSATTPSPRWLQWPSTAWGGVTGSTTIVAGGWMQSQVGKLHSQGKSKDIEEGKKEWTSLCCLNWRCTEETWTHKQTKTQQNQDEDRMKSRECAELDIPTATPQSIQAIGNSDKLTRFHNALTS